MRAVSKLRLGFLALACLTLLIAVVAIAGVSRVQTLNANLSERALPVLFELDAISAISVDIAQKAQSFGNARNFEQISTIANQISQSDQQFLASFEKLEIQDPSLQLGDLANAINRIQDLTFNVEDLAKSELKQNANFDLSVSDLNDSLTQLATLSEDARTLASLAISRSQMQQLDIDQYRKSLAIHSTVESLLAEARSLMLINNLQDLKENRELTALYLRTLFSTIARLPDNDYRNQISDLAVGIYDILSDQGIYTPKRSAILINTDLRFQLARLLEETSNLQSATAAIVEKQRNLTFLQKEQMSRTVRGVSLTLIVVCTISLTAAGLLIFEVVERQISRRLKTVYENAERIEQGIYTEPVHFEGKDEIAALGRSVDRLRELSQKQTKIEETLRIAQKAAETAAQTKSEFLAVMSHEVRTPLNSIMGMFELLERADIPEKQKKRAGMGRKASDNLFELLSNVLDASRIEAGSMDLAKSNVDTAEITEYLSSLLEGVIAKSGKNLMAEVCVATKLPPFIHTDGVRLKQILTNLIDNAVRFTTDGSVVVRIESMISSKIVSFQVIDTGIGIQRSDQEIIFEPFRQTDSGIKRRTGGSGLGLAISKNLANLLGGELRCESSPGIGSTFILSIPAEFSPGETTDEK
ncbi:ATP-binding protein [Parasulfitobacter algicola]|uniref:histidine kinase n=1 Tax=Parasulfitobacter algicola TaxID=2614809 RepID=A0ABX2IWC6_9RHOB|nr:ATP-binding protein [Sulfitobacter algicola]NSX54621.1 HAMP domain-containing protein [Sulfitobacter algicola]